MPLGLHSASATFQWVLDQVIVIGSTLEEHRETLKEEVRRL